MMERETAKYRETEARPPNSYEYMMAEYAEFRRRANEGRVVIKATEQPWQQSRQGRLKYFLFQDIKDTAVYGWRLFVHDIRSHSGQHRHQGGLAIYVIEGRGWTTVDGVRHDWEEGDLVLLPIKPHGVVHQHFNAEPGKPCLWLAMIYGGFIDALGYAMEQKMVSPDWKGQAE